MAVPKRAACTPLYRILAGKLLVKTNKSMTMPMASIVQGWSTSLHGCGIVRNVWTRCAAELHAICVFCSTLLSFVFAGRLGINHVDLGLMCLSLCGHGRRQPLRRRKMMMVFVANCVATVLVMYVSVALAT